MRGLFSFLLLGQNRQRKRPNQKPLRDQRQQHPIHPQPPMRAMDCKIDGVHATTHYQQQRRQDQQRHVAPLTLGKPHDDQSDRQLLDRVCVAPNSFGEGAVIIIAQDHTAAPAQLDHLDR